MPIVRIPAAGAIGVNSDLSAHELPPNAWTDARNIRFLDGSALQFLGHGEVYNGPTVAPQYVMPVNVAGVRYWLYVSAGKAYAVTNQSGAAVHTDITHAAPHAGIVNQWTGAILGGIPVLNVGDTSKVPMYWDLNLTHKFLDLPNWPANTYCKSLRRFKNFLVAVNITEGGVNYPYKLMWSHPADPGTLPSTWDPNDGNKDAGNLPVSDSSGPLVDCLGLKDSLIVYAENSTHALDYIGGTFVMRNRKVFGMSGIMNRNCAVEFDTWHLALTASDVVIHDSYNAQSVLDKKSRRFLFQNIDVTSKDKCFVFKNPFLNEIFICYPSFGATTCDRAMVYNYVDKTVSFRDMPNVSHAEMGPVDNTLAGNWNQDNDTWGSDLTAWNGPDFTPDTARVIMASADSKLFMLDASASFNGVLPNAFLERRGLSFGEPEYRKIIRSIRPRIKGNTGDTVIIKVGGSDDPFLDPVYMETITHVIGSTVTNDCLVDSRYPAIRFETGTAYQWRLDSYDVDVEKGGMY